MKVRVGTYQYVEKEIEVVDHEGKYNLLKKYRTCERVRNDEEHEYFALVDELYNLLAEEGHIEGEMVRMYVEDNLVGEW